MPLTNAQINKLYPAESDCLELALSFPGIDPNVVDGLDLQTAMIISAYKGALRCVELLAAFPGTTVHHVERRNNCSPIRMAAFGGHYRVVEVLLAVRTRESCRLVLFPMIAPLTARVVKHSILCPSSDTHSIAHHHHLQTPGADPSLGNAYGTPVFCGVFGKTEGHERCVEMLCAAPGVGATINALTVESLTPLIFALRFGRHRTLAALLTVEELDLNGVDDHDQAIIVNTFIHIGDKGVEYDIDEDWDGLITTSAMARDAFVPLLRSRRISKQHLIWAIHSLKRVVPGHRGLPTAEEVEVARTGGVALTTQHKVSRLLAPVLEAELDGRRRWCGGCLCISPDADLELCAGCKVVGYCDEKCQQAHWSAGHEEDCPKFAAEMLDSTSFRVGQRVSIVNTSKNTLNMQVRLCKGH